MSLNGTPQTLNLCTGPVPVKQVYCTTTAANRNEETKGPSAPMAIACATAQKDALENQSKMHAELCCARGMPAGINNYVARYLAPVHKLRQRKAKFFHNTMQLW